MSLPAPDVSRDSIPARLRGHGGPLLAFVLLTVVHTWPMASNPAGLSLHWNHDAAEMAWIVTWVADWLPRAPLSLLDANIFYPADNALVTCEPMIVTGAMGVPIRALGADAVLTHNLLWLLGFVLSGFCMYLLVHHLTGDRWAGVLAGTLFIFNAHIQSRLPHLMAIHQEWVPLALLAFERLLEDPRTRHAVGLGLAVALAAMSSGHVTVYVLVLLVAVMLSRTPDWWPRRRAFLTRLALAMTVTAAVALPVLHPWLRSVPRRDPETTSDLAATLASYVSALSNLHRGLWSWRFYDRTEVHLFVGFTALGLAVLAVVVHGRRGGRWRRRSLGYLLAGLLGVVLSLGAATPVFGIARVLFPPLAAIRVPGRLGFVFMTAVAVLAGLGLAALRSRLEGRRRWALAASLLLLLAVNVEALNFPLPVQEYEGIPEIYERVARLPEGTVLAEFPAPGGPMYHDNAWYMLYSTAHWKPIVNGYATFYPEGFAERSRDLVRFPHAAALRRLTRLGVTHVVVHYDRYPRREARRVRGIVRGLPMLLALTPEWSREPVLYRFGGRRARSE